MLFSFHSHFLKELSKCTVCTSLAFTPQPSLVQFITLQTLKCLSKKLLTSCWIIKPIQTLPFLPASLRHSFPKAPSPLGFCSTPFSQSFSCWTAMAARRRSSHVGWRSSTHVWPEGSQGVRPAVAGGVAEGWGWGTCPSRRNSLGEGHYFLFAIGGCTVDHQTLHHHPSEWEKLKWSIC